MTQRHRIAGLDRGLAAGTDLIPGLDPFGSEDVAALAVGVQHQRNMRGTIRVVLDALDHTGDAVLVAPEVDQTILLPRTAADVARGDASEMIARSGLALRHGQRRVGLTLVQVIAADTHLKARPGRGGFELDQRHGNASSPCARAW